jgi:membrane-associated phospholipid phosphatase
MASLTSSGLEDWRLSMHCRFLPRRLALVLLATAMVLGSLAAPARADETLRTIGDILQIALPVAGGGSTFFSNPDPSQKWDREGTRQFAWAYGSAWVTTYALKGIASKMRPNGENQTSFPSGHTMSAFAGAGFIDGRYGWKWGLPSLGLALLTGISRVESSWHYADDVVAGASIGLISNWHFVTPQTGKVSVLPTVGAAGVGIELSVRPGRERTASAWTGERPRGPGYLFAFGPAGVVRNRVLSKEPGATEFDLNDFEKRNDPVTTASANVLLPVGARGLVRLSYAPFEAKDFGSFSQGTNFGGETFDADAQIISGWRFHDLHGLYRYDLVAAEHWTVSLGAGLSFFDSYVRLEQQGGDTVATVSDNGVFPFGIAAVRWQVGGSFAVEGSAEGVKLGDEHLLAATAGVVYQLDRFWDLGLNYMYFSRKIDTAELSNDVIYNVAQIGLTRWW